MAVSITRCRRGSRESCSTKSGTSPGCRDDAKERAAHSRTHGTSSSSSASNGDQQRESRATPASAVAHAARTRGDRIYPQLPRPARRAALGGMWLQTAGAHYGAGNPGIAAHALGKAGETLPRALFADAEADDTAAEVWTR